MQALAHTPWGWLHSFFPGAHLLMPGICANCQWPSCGLSSQLEFLIFFCHSWVLFVHLRVPVLISTCASNSCLLASGACSCVPGACSCVPSVSSCVPGACSCVPGACSCVPGACSCVPGACLCVPGPCSCVPSACSCVPVACSCSCVPGVHLQVCVRAQEGQDPKFLHRLRKNGIWPLQGLWHDAGGSSTDSGQVWLRKFKDRQLWSCHTCRCGALQLLAQGGGADGIWLCGMCVFVCVCAIGMCVCDEGLRGAAGVIYLHRLASDGRM